MAATPIPIIPLGQGMRPLWPDRVGPWPGEPSEGLTESPELLVRCSCGQRLPFSDVALVRGGPYDSEWRCLDCWMQSRAAVT